MAWGAGALVAAALAAAVPAAGERSPAAGGSPLYGDSTPRQGELRETVPITRRKGAAPRSVLSLALPRAKQGDRLRFNGEVTLTTTCVDSLERCIGRRYGFDPRLRAWVVLAQRPGAAAGADVRRVSEIVGLRCEQTRPNRNHHCPLVISQAISVKRLGALPCPPDDCRLNMVVGAHHPRARGGEVVVVGADRPDGTIEGGKGRLGVSVARAARGVDAMVHRTAERRTRELPASFSGGQRVVYSQRLGGLAAGDVLIARARQRARIRSLPYFVAAKVVIAARPNAKSPGPLASRTVSRRGTATETNGFNCTLGPSAFRSPCTTRKAGLAVIKRAPTNRRGQPVPLYVNLVSRTFPKRAQAGRGTYPPARVLRGGGLVVRHLHAER